MHIPNNPVCFPHTTTDSKHDLTNSNERKHSYVWNLMHNSVQRISKTDSFQNVWKNILMSCCSPSVRVNTHTKKMLWTLIHSWLRRLYQPRRENNQVISWLALSEIIHNEPTSFILHFKQEWQPHKKKPVWRNKKTEDALSSEVSLPNFLH
jgi:hypothetical protein